MNHPVSLLIVFALIATVHGAPIEQVPHARITPKIQADPNDPAWKESAVIPDLSLSIGEDAKGLSPSPTEIRLLWDEDFLYFRFSCEDAGVESPYEGRDQPHYKGDVVEVFLDVAGDGRNYLELQVSPGNEIFDQQISLDAPPVSDETGRLQDAFLVQHFHMNQKWDMPGLRTSSTLHKGGWLVDIAIPSKAVGLEKWQPATLRAHLMRYDWLTTQEGVRRLISMNWASVPYGCPHISPAAMGRLELLPKK